MLGTTIIASALVTGDTMNRTVRVGGDRVARHDRRARVGAAAPTRRRPRRARQAASAPTTSTRRTSRRSSARCARTGLVDGVAPAIIEPVAVQDLDAAARPRRASSLFARRPGRAWAASARSATAAARTVSLADLEAGEVYLDRDAADALGARAGDRLRVLAGVREATARASRRSSTTTAPGSDGAAVLLPLRARAGAARARRARSGTCSCPTAATRPSGAALTDDVVARGRCRRSRRSGSSCRTSSGRPRGWPTSQGDVFVSIFTTFGSFSIAAGILLIFLIFVMLSAERRPELGIARAVGTRREHLVQMFVVRGPRLRPRRRRASAPRSASAVAFAMVAVMADAFSTTGLEIQHARHAAQPRRRVRARRAADVRRRRRVRLAREPC